MDGNMFNGISKAIESLLAALPWLLLAVLAAGGVGCWRDVAGAVVVWLIMR